MISSVVSVGGCFFLDGGVDTNCVNQYPTVLAPSAACGDSLEVALTSSSFYAMGGLFLYLSHQ